MEKFTIILDSREQKGWTFRASEHCAGSKIQKLDTGDVSIEGMEEIVSIERKLSVSEIAQNLNQKRFFKELERLRTIKHAYIICEFSISDILTYPASLPYKVRRKIKMRGPYVLKRLVQLQMEYPEIKLIFAGGCGQEICLEILKMVYSLEVKDE